MSPVGGFPNFDACVLHMTGKGHSEEEARRICGALEQQMHASLAFEAMALDIPEFPEHPNRVPFSGVLTQLDQPSDVSPHGAAGHRVVLPSEVAEAALPSLLGMAVNYRPGLEGHDVRRKIGVISEARIENGELRVAGYLFGKDFPEAVKEIRAHREQMGMSYEVTEVQVADADAEIWVLDNVVFTGAAILKREAAAYKRTSLAATRSTGSGHAAGAEQGGEMEKQEVEKTVMAKLKEFFASLGSEERKPAAALTEEQINASVTKAVEAAVVPFKTELAALREENMQLKAAGSTAHAEARREKWNATVAAAQKAGKLVPALLAGLQAQAELAIATAKVKVMELQADKTSKEVEVDPLDALVKHLETLPQIVPLGELAAEAQRAHGNVIEMRFNETKDLQVDAESVELNAQAEAIAAELRKQDPKLTDFAAFKEGLSRARAKGGAIAKAGGMTAGKA